MGLEEAEAGPDRTDLGWFSPQVQSIEFTQIEMKVIEGLQFGNECLNKMHQVGPPELEQDPGLAPLSATEAMPAPRLSARRCLCWMEGGEAHHCWERAQSTRTGNSDVDLRTG